VKRQGLSTPCSAPCRGRKSRIGTEIRVFAPYSHAFASRMIDRGISSTVLAKLMGHESSAITERRYIHLYDKQRTDDAVRQAMASVASVGG
jgi:integrase